MDVCPNCGETDYLFWDAVTQPTAVGVSDGRYCARDFKAVIFQGCEYCSETVVQFDANSERGIAFLNRS